MSDATDATDATVAWLAEHGDPLPTGVTVLCRPGDEPAPIERILAASPVEPDSEREGIRVLLAIVLRLLPRLAQGPLDEFVAVAARFMPPLARRDPALVASVARAMGIG